MGHKVSEEYRRGYRVAQGMSVRLSDAALKKFAEWRFPRDYDEEYVKGFTAFVRNRIG